MPNRIAAKQQNTALRDVSMDNIRFLLILLVVFAHLLESVPSSMTKTLLYRNIYAFHMPAFIFLFGYFASFSPRKLAFRWVIPYFVFQVLYILFSQQVLGKNIAMQFTTPHWILWFLLAGIFYQLLIPLYASAKKFGQVAVLGVTVAMALLAGFDETAGYKLTISRFCVFQPWFVLGLYCRKNGILEKLAAPGWRKYTISTLSAVAVVASVVFLCRNKVSLLMLYGSGAYSEKTGTVWLRLRLMLIAFCWIAFLFVAFRPLLKKKLFLITAIGQTTLPVFLLHGFLVKTIDQFYPQWLSNPGYAFLLTIPILLITGNPVSKKLVEYISFSWLERFVKKEE